MNHVLLKALIAEAQNSCYNRDPWAYGDAKMKQTPLIFEEEFTKLIVEECFNVMAKYSPKLPPIGDKVYMHQIAAIEKFANMKIDILNNFGIE